MNRSIKKIPSFTLFLSSVLLQGHLALANESGDKTLSNTVGASDYYKVACSANENGATDHLGFKVIDTTIAPTETITIAPQLINARITKEAVVDEALALAPGDSQELNIPLGNGRYNISLDTVGTDVDLKNTQTFTIKYQCLNSSGVDTKSSAAGLKSAINVVKAIKNNKVSKFSINCAAQNKTSPADTEKLYFEVVNTTLATDTPVVINAHISKEIIVSEALAIAPGDRKELTVPRGNGKYNIQLDTVGTNLSLRTAQRHTLQYRCLNSDGIDTKSSAVGLKPGFDVAKSITNNKITKYAVNCAAKNTLNPADTEHLFVKIANTSAVAVDPSIAGMSVLNAQVYQTSKTLKTSKTLNTTDITGDLLYGNEITLKGGDGAYFIAVNNTGTNAGVDNSKQYSFQYSCLNSANLETVTSELELIQDQ